MKALVIEDDSDLAAALADQLALLGYQIDTADNGKTGVAMALAQPYAFIVFDLGLPELEGVEVCKQIRAGKPGVPLIALTASADDTNKVLLLELGADDYITKPFNPMELKARIKTILRRCSVLPVGKSQLPFSYRELRIDFETRQVFVENSEIALTASEFELLTLLASNRGRVFTREEINDALFGYEIVGYDDTLSSRVNRLRNKLEPDKGEPKYVLTVRGVGYRLGLPDDG